MLIAYNKNKSFTIHVTPKCLWYFSYNIFLIYYLYLQKLYKLITVKYKYSIRFIKTYIFRLEIINKTTSILQS